MKGFKRKSDTVCLEFRKMPLAAACSFEKKRDQGGGWNKMPGERRRGLNAWEMGPRETLNLWCGDQMRVWTVLVTCEPSPPGLLRFSDSVLKTPYLSNTKCLLVSLYIYLQSLTSQCPASFSCLQSGVIKTFLNSSQELKAGVWSASKTRQVVHLW